MELQDLLKFIETHFVQKLKPYKSTIIIEKIERTVFEKLLKKLTLTMMTICIEVGSFKIMYTYSGKKKAIGCTLLYETCLILIFLNAHGNK